ncbi:ROK family transcriptional regulator [Streptacidiphilus sp. MAP5-3]|uniref:ROK family transcriptional regulator n=1 Tax=unclassified Streptacidiphilus TaxID=2643834 RepID=UPI003512734E
MIERSGTADPTSWTSTVAQPADVGRRNVAAIMRTVLAHGPQPRARIAELTGLSAGTVTRLTARLTSAGLLHELPGVRGPEETGRPRIPLDLPPARSAVVGIHIGLLRTTVGLVDPRGVVLGQAAHPHHSFQPGELVTQAADAVAELVEELGRGRRILGVGVGIGGWVDTEHGIVVEHQPLGWYDVPLRSLLATALGRPLRLEGTVRAMALAESWYGAATNARSMVELFIGNVIGSALVLDRSIHGGPRSAAGTLTHLPVAGARGVRCGCGRYDCLHAVATDEAVLALARASGAASEHDAFEDLVRRAQQGDRAAGTLLRRRARHVGRAAALVLDLVNPELVVLAGGPLQTPEYLPDVRRELVRRSQLGAEAAARLVPSALGPHALVLSSAAPFLDAYFSDPLGFEQGFGHGFEQGAEKLVTHA